MRWVLVVVIFVAVLLQSYPAAAADWSVQLGGAYGVPSSAHTSLKGGGVTLGAACSLRPWMSMGPELGWYRLDDTGDRAYFDFPSKFDPTNVFTLTAATRFMVPNTTGIVPFAGLETGLARIRWGDEHVQYIYAPGPAVLTRPSETVVCAGLGFGIRGAWSRPLPRFELGARFLTLAGEDAQSLIMVRLSAMY